jgi:GDPmannose 4,6-dehydratase
LNLAWSDYVDIDPSLLRPTDIRRGIGDPTLASRVLGWKARHKMRDVVNLMIAAERDTDV